jgi:FkbM family methyltransferase
MPPVWQWLKYRQYLRHGEPEIHFLKELIDPERYAIDVGVHLGMYTRHMARYAKGVFAFEANPESAALVEKCLGHLPGVKLQCCAISSEVGIATLRIPLSGANGAEAALGTISVKNPIVGQPTRSVEVPARPLDDMDLPPIGFVKIDVEGHEEEVLKGGENLLKRDRPIYMIEIENRHNSGGFERICIAFLNNDYTVHYLKNGSLIDWKDDDRTNGEKFLNNFFFLPNMN